MQEENSQVVPSGTTGSDLDTGVAAEQGNSHTPSFEDVLDGDPFEESDEEKVSEEEQVEEKEVKTDEPKFDKDLDSWAESQGYGELNTDLERKLAQRARDNQRALTKDRQAPKAAEAINATTKEIKSEVGENDDESDPTVKRLNQMDRQLKEERNLRLQSEFFSSRTVADTVVKGMSDIIREKVDKAPDSKKSEVLEYWSDPSQLEDLYELATAREHNANGTSVIKDEATKEERERIAKEQAASGPMRNAKTSQPAEKEDPLLKILMS